MVEEVNRLVGNLLAGGGEVSLPGVGSLRTERRAAQRLSGRKVLPPCRVVTFSSEERGTALPVAIASAARCSMEEGRDIYERWLGRTHVDGVLTIEGVGVLKFKHFTPDPAFDARLNPAGREPVRIRKTSRFDWSMWVGIAAILIALFFGGREFLMLYSDQEVVEQPAAPRGNASVEQPDALAVAEPVVPEQTGAAGSSATEPAAGMMGAEPAAGTTPQSDSAVADEAQSGAAAGTNLSGTQSAATAAGSASRSSSPSTAAPDAPASLVAGRYYVVLGVFSTPENAARAASQAAAKVSGPEYAVYRFGSKFMVSPLDAADAAACAEFIRSHSGTFPDLWTYRAR